MLFYELTLCEKGYKSSKSLPWVGGLVMWALCFNYPVRHNPLPGLETKSLFFSTNRDKKVCLYFLKNMSNGHSLMNQSRQ